MAIQALAVVPAKVASTVAQVATTVAKVSVQAASTVGKATAQAAHTAGRGAAQGVSTAGRTAAQGATRATSQATSAASKGVHGASNATRGMSRAMPRPARPPRPNGILSQAKRSLETVKQNDPPSGEGLMRAKAERFRSARASSKGPFTQVKSMFDQFVEMASGKNAEQHQGR